MLCFFETSSIIPDRVTNQTSGLQWGTGSLSPAVNVRDTQGPKLILDGNARSDLESDSETLGWLGYVCLSPFGLPVAL